MSKVIVFYDRYSVDGLFCREIASKFMPDAILMPIASTDPRIDIPADASTIFILGLPVDMVFGLTFSKTLTESAEMALMLRKVMWIDGHKDLIEYHPLNLVSHYCVEGVASCRLAWQYFSNLPNPQLSLLPEKEAYQLHYVSEPKAIRIVEEFVAASGLQTIQNHT